MQGLRISDLTSALLRSSSVFTSAGFLDFRKLSAEMTDEERSAVIIATLSAASLVGLFWDRTFGAIQVAPQRRVRIQWYYRWVRWGAAVLLALQLTTLLGTSSVLFSMQTRCIAVLLHATYLLAFIKGKTLHESPEVNLKHSSVPLRTTSQQLVGHDAFEESSMVPFDRYTFVADEAHTW
jgi:hypothetical protein